MRRELFGALFRSEPQRRLATKREEEKKERCLIHRQVLIKIASRLMKMYMCAAVRSGKACAACMLMALDVWLELRPGIDPKTLQEFKLC